MAATGKTPIAPVPETAPEQPFLTPERIRLLGYAGAGVLVIALAIWFTITAGQRKQSYAATALEQCRDAAAQANFGVAVQCYTKVVSSFSGTPSAYEATLGIAQTHLVAGQNELAITGLQEFLRTNPPPEAGSPASGLLGTAFENVGKFAEAEAAYRKASDFATVTYLKANALLDAGRAAYLAHKVDDAKAIYNEIITKYAKSGAMTEAQVRLAEITAKSS
jgi:outer membrane protein assembly factor BamD (BamD/ComL family)